MNISYNVCFGYLFLSIVSSLLAGPLTIFSGSRIISVAGKNQDRLSIDTIDLPDSNRTLYLAGVYDGHGTQGGAVAERIKNSFPINFKKAVSLGGAVDESLDFALLSAENFLFASKDLCYGGTTAVNACIEGSFLYLSNIGDSRAVIGQYSGDQLDAHQPIEDHGLDNQLELMRLADIGAAVMVRGCSRHKTISNNTSQWECPHRQGVHYYVKEVFGCRYTRSLGDLAIKVKAYTQLQKKVFLSSPDLVSIDLQPNRDRFLILASDGLWEESIESPITNDEAVKMVQEVLDEYGYNDESAQFAAQRLAEVARNRWGKDDIAVVVVLFDWQEDIIS